MKSQRSNSFLLTRLRPRWSGLFLKAFLLTIIFGVWGIQSAYAAITITPVSWNVVGLDSNNQTIGPDTFQIGARVCNTGGAAVTNVVGTFVWDSANIYLTLTGNNPVTVSSLNAGACTDFYFPVTVTRTALAFNTARRYHITASATGQATVSTPTPRELYVEKLISQNRNSINSITGPTTVFVGQTYTYTVSGSTATGGYAQLEAFLNLSNVIFQVQGIATTYTAPAGGTNDKFYADACGWDNNPVSGTYKSCIGPVNYPGGKAGGDISTTYTVKILSTGVTVASTLITDFSGSSYHYNNDYGVGVNSITITALPSLPNVALTKSVSPSGGAQIVPGADLTYTIAFTNNGVALASSLVIIDPIPANTDFKVGSVTTNLGTTGLTVVVAYSNNNGSTYVYTPVSGGGGAPAGYDRNVTNVRWTFSGNLSQIAPNNTGSVTFVSRIR